MPVELKVQGNVIRGKFRVGALDESNVHKLGDQLYGHLDRVSQPQVYLDLAEVQSLTSVALGKLLAVYRRVRQAGGHLALYNVEAAVYPVFEVTCLNKLFKVHRRGAA